MPIRFATCSAAFSVFGILATLSACQTGLTSDERSRSAPLVTYSDLTGRLSQKAMQEAAAKAGVMPSSVVVTDWCTLTAPPVRWPSHAREVYPKLPKRLSTGTHQYNEFWTNDALPVRTWCFVRNDAIPPEQWVQCPLGNCGVDGAYFVINAKGDAVSTHLNFTNEHSDKAREVHLVWECSAAAVAAGKC
jgi:hypothetical protein